MEPLIVEKKEPNSISEIDRILNPYVKQWFYSRFKEYSLPQLFGVYEIHTRQNILISAPTGATKTLTSFLSILNELVDSALGGSLTDSIHAVYVSPLKALNNDIQKNLIEPLQEIEKLCGKELGIRVLVRTGDTTQAQKSKMLKKPPHILITTPESLAIVLSSIKFKEHLNDTSWLIIDEIHALAESKRGVHLSLSMERLQSISPGMCRVGLSATVSPIEEMAQYLVGTKRPCKIVDVQFIKMLNLKVLSPVPNLITASYEKKQSETYKLIHKLISEHKTTLIFTNTRSATERVVHTLKEMFPAEYNDSNIATHHGSLSKQLRFQTEENLRHGRLRCVVCSTSLELGIDIGFIDLVILLGSPKSVARAIQRCGRAGHKLHETTKGRIIVLDRDDLVECSVLLKSAVEKKIDRIHIPKNCLDVLSQHIYGIVIQAVTTRHDLYDLIRNSYCYSDLSYDDFTSVLDFLSGKYVSLEDRHVYAKIWVDEETGNIGKRGRMARLIYMTNIGTIPDESYVTVKIGEMPIGKIDEAFLEKMKVGDIFVLGGQTYQFKYASGMVAQVIPVSGRRPTVPRWFSEMLPLSFELANEINRFRRLVEEKLSVGRSKAEILDFMHDYLYVDENGANSIYEYLKEQFQYAKISHDKDLVLEHTVQDGRKHAVFHTLYGRRVNDVLSRGFAYAVSRTQMRDVDIGINDNGFVLSTDKKINVFRVLRVLNSGNLREVMQAAIDRTEVLKRRFRHCAGRSLMILRNYKGREKKVGRQQVSSMLLLSAVKRISENFPILKEARREVLEDLMDIENAKKIFIGLESGDLKIHEITTDVPSPFAFRLMADGYTDIMKIEDRHEFLKRMHEYVLAKIDLKKRGLDRVAKVEFRYEDIWKAEELQKEEKKQDEKDVLKTQLLKVSRRINLPSDYAFEIERLIDGERNGFRQDFLQWLDILLSDVVPLVWSDELIKFLVKVKKEI
ncbi:ATP-dependent helicase [Candidatus Woesearchaeota archaeon CG11_big_fil_rev_8_21_14_0_20_43_8]|nr:MAG: ATP-dependent helicase [Candidatus Woesearchaeota archaeon CG11_big_fil_rev_8_21_14_0_20_43_8]PIO05229.1 MAG: ATP-dependent helicase [Candidatus Woesearchaeota archaeon CG08_land_8_20_14_0_20_43_7]